MLTLRRAVRGLLRRPRYATAFLFAGMLGLSGNLYLSALEGSIRSSLSAKSRELLTADISVSVRRKFTEAETVSIDNFLADKATEKSRLIDLYSMIATAKGSRLIKVVAIAGNYPLVGNLVLETAGVVRGSDPKALGNGQVWVDSDVRDALGLLPGVSAKVGDLTVRIQDIILEDTSNTWRGFTLAPRVFMTLQDLESSGLLKKGSTLWEVRTAILRPELDSVEVARTWGQIIPDTAIRVTPHTQASDQVARLSGYLNDYLGLVGLTTLFLALLGMSFLYQTELRRRLRAIGTLSALGDSPRRVASELSLEAAILGFASAIASLVLAVATLPISARVVSRLVGVTVEPRVSLLQGVLTLLFGGALGLFMAYPFASRVRRVRTSALFQEEAHIELPFEKRDGLALLPMAGAFYFLSVYQSHSWRVGSLFFGLTAVSIFGLYFIGGFLFRQIEKFFSKRDLGSLPFRLAIRSLARNPWSSLSAFIATGIGALLLSLIPSLQAIMTGEIERPEGSKVPSLFLFDIQEEQVLPLREHLTSEGVDIDFLSPMIRARLETLNGKPVTKSADLGERSTREQEEEERSRNRGYNLSYREGLSDSESISAGRSFRGSYDPSSSELPEVTIERKFADRLGIGVGDRIGFDVQGVPVEGKVVGLRNVRWTSFQPNFFIVFQPGAIDAAPKTFLGGVPALEPDRRRMVQEKIVNAFPNVSIIQVEELVRKLLRIFDQMGVAVRLTAFLSLITGLFVIFSIARRQVEVRRRGALLLKTVGADARDVTGIFLWEFGILSGSAALLGAGLSFVISRLLGWIVFERRELWMAAEEARIYLLAILVIIGVSTLSAAIAARGIARARPWKLLQSEDASA